MHWDVSDHKAAEEALRASEERLGRALQISTVGILLFSLDGQIIHANAAFERMSGYSNDDLRNLSDWSALAPPEFAEVIAQSSAALADRGDTAPYETQLNRKDGSRWWGLFAPTRVAGSGRESQCVAFVIDITAARQAEEAMRESESGFRTLVQNIQDYAIFRI